MKTPEGNLRDNVRNYLKTLKQCWYLKVHGGPMQLLGTPDYLVLYRGQFYGLELKVGKNKPTRIQLHIMEKIKQAGGTATVCRSVSEVENVLHGPRV